jgi:hypothetical protein
MVIGWGLDGFICLKLGRKWNRDVAFGQYHTLYSIRVEKWGIICLTLAAIWLILPIVFLIVAGMFYLVKHYL